MFWFRARAILGALLDGLWFHPIVGLALGVGLALLAPWGGRWLAPATVHALQPALASLQQALRALAGLSVTLLALSLSVLMVVLQSVATQHSPRMVRSVLRAQVGQWTVAAFAVSAGYALTGLALLEGPPHPTLLVALALEGGVLTALNVGAFVYFIHYFTFSLQAPNLAYRVHHTAARAQAHAETCETRLARTRAQDGASWPASPGRRVTARDVEYLQALDAAALLRFSARHDLYVRVMTRVGDLVPGDGALLEVWPAERATPSLVRGLQSAFFLANDRQVEADATYGFELLAEMALRALSPDRNDPRTAETCIGYLRDLLVRSARASAPSSALCDAAGTPRLLREVLPFEQLLDRALGDVAREAARRHPPLLCALLELLEDVAHAATAPDRRRATVAFARGVAKLEPHGPLLPADRRRLAERRASLAGPAWAAPSRRGPSGRGAQPSVPSFAGRSPPVPPDSLRPVL